MADILIVDDTPEMRNVMTLVLRQRGHITRTAADGSLGLAAIRHQKPDLLVLDIDMPVMNGYELLQELKRENLRSNMRILILTAQNREADWKKGYKHGANQYLTKPFEPTEFAEAVEKLLAISDEEAHEFKAAEEDRADLLSQLEKFFD